MEHRVTLVDWDYEGDQYIKLLYKDNDILYVKRTIFDRSFGAIVGASKEAYMRDFDYHRTIIGG